MEKKCDHILGYVQTPYEGASIVCQSEKYFFAKDDDFKYGEENYFFKYCPLCSEKLNS